MNKYKLLITNWSFRNLTALGRKMASKVNAHRLHEQNVIAMFEQQCTLCGEVGAERYSDSPDGHVRILCPSCGKGIN